MHVHIFRQGIRNELAIVISPSQSNRKSGENVKVEFTYPLKPIMPFATCFIGTDRTKSRFDNTCGVRDEQ